MINETSNNLFVKPSATVSDAYHELATVFEECGIRSAKLDARLLVCHTFQLSHEEFIMYPQRPASLSELVSLREAGRRRAEREPVSRITGRREFWSQTYLINEFTLDPRPDTELVVINLLELLSAGGRQSEELRILDLGTGCGCLLLSLLMELPCAFGTGTDISIGALDIANINCLRLGLENRARFLKSDWWEDVEGKFDIIVSNPPYIKQEEIRNLDREVSVYDPLTALDGGKDGLRAYKEIIGPIKRYLSSDGVVAVEIGTDQKNQVESLFRHFDFEVIGERRDLSGISRCVAAKMR